MPTIFVYTMVQTIAQRSLQASEETLETIDVSDARNRLREDIDALRNSLVQIEARLHEVCILYVCVCMYVYIYIYIYIYTRVD